MNRFKFIVIGPTIFSYTALAKVILCCHFSQSKKGVNNTSYFICRQTEYTEIASSKNRNSKDCFRLKTHEPTIQRSVLYFKIILKFWLVSNINFIFGYFLSVFSVKSQAMQTNNLFYGNIGRRGFCSLVKLVAWVHPLWVYPIVI